MIEAYPLHWPQAWPRTKHPGHSRFGQNWCDRVSMTTARDKLIEEIRRLGGTKLIVSTNIILRNDGLPRANQRRPEDTGVAVYFMLNGEQKCFPCDKWDRVECNIYAIGKTIDALRGIERWGSKRMVDATFNGFKALPEPNSQAWHEVLGVSPFSTKDRVQSAYRELSLLHHPDKGGSANAFDRISKAYKEGMRVIT